MSPKSRKYDKLDRCPQCHGLICKRIWVHDNDDEQLIIEIQHRGIKILTFSAIITCARCRCAVRVTGKDGIVEKMQNAPSYSKTIR